MDVNRFSAVVFGEGDFHLRTEDRPLPPALENGDTVVLGPLRATVEDLLGHPRLVSLLFDGSADQIWAGLASHGRPIQYSHLQTSLELWDVWTRIAGPPVAFEAPSASFILDWHVLAAIREHRAAFAAITHAAGISSTGDEDLDHLLPFDEPYHIPLATAKAVELTRRRGGRVIAVGTTVGLLGLPNPVMWGVMVATLNFVPYLGALTGIICMTIGAVLSFDSLGYALIFPAVYLAFGTLEGNFITPWVMGRSLTLNPVIILLSLVFWGWMWGIAGVILAVPILAAFKIFCAHIKPMEPLAEFLS